MTIALYLLLGAVFVLIFTREVIAPASGASCDRRWQVLASVLNLLQVTGVLLAGFLFPTTLFSHSLLALGDSLGPLMGGMVTFLVASLLAYWWHRATHRGDFLWRTIHQLHHSPDRIEAHTAFFVHPLDAFVAAIITSLSGFLILGLDVESVGVGLFLAAAYNFYIHSDTNSPRWLGIFIQRPEMHRVHHQRHHQADNYGLPLWDLLFGTWKNPVDRVTDCGFEPHEREQIKAMLLGRDVSPKQVASNVAPSSEIDNQTTASGRLTND